MKNESELSPRDHGEATAHFRAQVIGELAAREMGHGELSAALREKAQQRFRPPGSKLTRSYAVSTLERWLYRFLEHGIQGLRPRTRADLGAGRVLKTEERTLLLEIRKEYSSMSAELILRTAERKGLIEKGAMSPNTLRRMYRDHDLPRLSKRTQAAGKQRRRWEAAFPSQLWHGDVCHGPTLEIGGQKRALRIHGLMDDNSRYVVALVALHQEREADMLQVYVDSLRRWGKSEVLYLDNGSTYRGETLATACNRLNVKLVHAQPYDPQARGKMERFWRTMREQCLDHLPAGASLHDVQMRLLAWLEQDYHQRAHSSLLGDSPAERWLQRKPQELSEPALQDALTLRVERRLRGDGTVSVGGLLWETEEGYLAGSKVVVARTLAVNAAPWIERDEQRLALRLVDPKGNAQRGRAQRGTPKAGRKGIDAIAFDPVQPLVDLMVGKKGGTQ